MITACPVTSLIGLLMFMMLQSYLTCREHGGRERGEDVVDGTLDCTLTDYTTQITWLYTETLNNPK